MTSAECSPDAALCADAGGAAAARVFVAFAGAHIVKCDIAKPSKQALDSHQFGHLPDSERKRYTRELCGTEGILEVDKKAGGAHSEVFV